MATDRAPVFETPAEGEEAARADLYGTVASLFCAPPSQALLERIGAAGPGDHGLLGAAWCELVRTARNMDAESVREEYEHLFIGVGKPEVMLYGSYYLSGFLMEKPLLILRTDLAKLGLQRAEQVVESEDHIAMLCEVMRYLILSKEEPEASLLTQKNFFTDHLQPWASSLCVTLEARPDARFYAPAARFTRCFFEIEMQAFDLYA